MVARLLPGPFTVDSYHRLAELGILDEDDRVELLDGQIVEMTPIGGAHAACVIRLTNLLARRAPQDTGVSRSGRPARANTRAATSNQVAWP